MLHRSDHPFAIATLLRPPPPSLRSSSRLSLSHTHTHKRVYFYLIFRFIVVDVQGEPITNKRALNIFDLGLIISETQDHRDSFTLSSSIPFSGPLRHHLLRCHQQHKTIIGETKSGHMSNSGSLILDLIMCGIGLHQPPGRTLTKQWSTWKRVTFDESNASF